MEKQNIILKKKFSKTVKKRSTQLEYLGFQTTQKINFSSLIRFTQSKILWGPG